nr:membrane protein insertion efficiency factor YidD [Thiocapsa sp. KS1]
MRVSHGLAPVRLWACCRFEPSGSNDAIQALETHSPRQALRLIALRLRRCRLPDGGRDELPGCHSRGARP